jgi:glycosyltransferase involved in cell wall biosynthesis
MTAPVVSMLLISYNQQDTIEAAVQGALAQTLPGLEIVICDDASTDATFARIQSVVSAYQGPHRVVVHRHARNLGVGGNLAHAVSLSSGALLVVTAGDDVSVPHRCERLCQVWDSHGRRLDLLASDLVDVDERGQVHGVLRPSDLGAYRSAADWLACRPHVVGAAQAWTRRLYDHFGPLPQGVVAEDLIMVFRAICLGGALYVPEALVRYRRGGLSGRRRAMSVDDVIKGWLSNNRHSLVELPVLRADAQKAGCLPVMQAWLDAQWAHEVLIRDVFQGQGAWRRTQALMRARGVPWGKRWRVWLHAVCPAALAPLFWLKRLKPRA